MCFHILSGLNDYIIMQWGGAKKKYKIRLDKCCLFVYIKSCNGNKRIKNGF